MVGFAMVQLISRKDKSAEARVQSQAISCGIYDRRSGTGTDLPLSIPGFSCQYHSTNSIFVNHQRYIILIFDMVFQNTLIKNRRQLYA